MCSRSMTLVVLLNSVAIKFFLFPVTIMRSNLIDGFLKFQTNQDIGLGHLVGR